MTDDRGGIRWTVSGQRGLDGETAWLIRHWDEPRFHATVLDRYLKDSTRQTLAAESIRWDLPIHGAVEHCFLLRQAFLVLRRSRDAWEAACAESGCYSFYLGSIGVSLQKDPCGYCMEASPTVRLRHEEGARQEEPQPAGTGTRPPGRLTILTNPEVIRRALRPDWLRDES